MITTASKLLNHQHIILGIHDGHNSSATLMVNGNVIYSIQEERLTRRKNECGYPKLAIDEVLHLSNIKPAELSEIAVASEYMHSKSHLENVSTWYKASSKRQSENLASLNNHQTQQDNLKRRQLERTQEISDHLIVDKSKVHFYNHHECHAAAAYYGSDFKFDEEILVLTCDGAGDGLCASVSIGHKGKIRRISESDRKNSPGKVYSRVTYYLGFQPWEHEYKIMGMAPYAEPKYSAEINKLLGNMLTYDAKTLKFESNDNLHMDELYPILKTIFERKRFDAICGGVQLFIENLITNWVAAAIEVTGIRKIVLGGGVFMNVKCNKLISELEVVDSMYIFPSCGDESLSFGSAWIANSKLQNSSSELPKLRHLYLGGECSDDEILESESVLGTLNYQCDTYPDINARIAELLSEGEIVARCTGRMEWGARALGNRSILSAPSEWENVEKINSMIKKRDFWMPFAPSIQAEYADQLVCNGKSINSPFMMLAFDSIPSKVSQFRAALHPRDKTARVQYVHKESNPEYWCIIDNFRKITGIPCVLNTSFNLHGFPLVYKPKEAFEVFLNSGLRYLAINSRLYSKI